MSTLQETSENLLSFCGDKRYSTIYADPPWRFQNRTGKVAPENICTFGFPMLSYRMVWLL